MKSIIVDSGSTKSSWCLIEDGRVTEIEADGINPVFNTAEQIRSIIDEQVVPQLGKTADKVAFYGAGCVDEAAKGLISNLLGEQFGCDALVENDITGAACALFNQQDGIAAIMGTGSACALYQGGAIVKAVPSGGFILGDEGSGGALGRALIADYIKCLVPKEIEEEINEKEQLSYPEIVKRVYKMPNPNRWLASFAPLLCHNRDNDYVRGLLQTQFGTFFERNIMRFNPSKELKVGIVGSIGYFFEAEIREQAARYGVDIERIIRKPIEGLIEIEQGKR